MTLKEHFVDSLVADVVKEKPAGTAMKIMDLGCGTAAYVPALLKKYPNLTYVGIEPIPSSFETAQRNLAGLTNAIVHFQLGYGEVASETESSCDLVFSLSVLEHIKQLDRFIALSAHYAKPGGTVVHRYDLGHALYPHSLKERLHVWLGNTIPSVLPERKFVRYVPEAEVRELYQHSGLTPTKTTYHQMPGHKHLEKFLAAEHTNCIDDVFAWEQQHQAAFASVPVPDREQLFPTVAVFGQKQ